MLKATKSKQNSGPYESFAPQYEAFLLHARVHLLLTKDAFC